MNPLITQILAVLTPQAPAPAFQPSVYGLELPVRDVRAAERAYVDGLGFRALVSGGEMARLVKDGLELVLVRSDAPATRADAASVHLNLEARDLELCVERALAAGLELPEPEPRTNPIGRAVSVRDADGHVTNLIDLDATAGRGDDTLRSSTWASISRLAPTGSSSSAWASPS